MIELNFGLVWTVVNVIVLYIIYRKFLYNRIKAMIDARRKQIKKQYADAAKEQKQAAKLKKKYEKSLKSAMEESQRIISEAQARGEAEYNRIVGEANAQAERIMADASANIEMEREAALKDAKTQITELAMLAAAKIIGDSANAQSDESLYNDFLNKTGGQE